MSAEDVEILRGLYDEWGRGDYTRSDVFSPDVVMSVDENFPDIMIEPGYEGLLAVLKMWLSSWEKPFIVEADEMIDLGEYVVVTVHWHGVSTAHRQHGGAPRRPPLEVPGRQGRDLQDLPRPGRGLRRRSRGPELAAAAGSSCSARAGHHFQRTYISRLPPSRA